MPPVAERSISVVLVPPGAEPGPDLRAVLVSLGWGIRVEHDPYGAMASAGRAARPRGANEPSFERVTLVVAAPTDPLLVLALDRYLPEIDVLRWDGSELAAILRDAVTPPPVPPSVPDLRLSPTGRVPPALDDEPDPADVQLTREEIDMLLATEPPEP